MAGKTGTAQVRKIVGAIAAAGVAAHGNRAITACSSVSPRSTEPRYAAPVVIEHGLGGSAPQRRWPRTSDLSSMIRATPWTSLRARGGLGRHQCAWRRNGWRGAMPQPYPASIGRCQAMPSARAEAASTRSHRPPSRKRMSRPFVPAAGRRRLHCRGNAWWRLLIGLGRLWRDRCSIRRPRAAVSSPMGGDATAMRFS